MKALEVGEDPGLSTGARCAHERKAAMSESRRLYDRSRARVLWGQEARKAGAF